jgi:hypothetical protein
MVSVGIDILQLLSVFPPDYFSLSITGKQISFYLISQLMNFTPAVVNFLVQQHRPVQLDRFEASKLEGVADPARGNFVPDEASR